MNTTYCPGEWVAVTSRDGWLLAEIDPTDLTALVAWGLLRSGAGLDALLDALLAKGLQAVRNFALARANADGTASVVVRGTGAVTVRTDEGQERISGDGVATWRETSVPAGWDALELSAGADLSKGALPLSPGITLAGGIRVGRDESAQREVRAPDDVPAPTEAIRTDELLADEPALEPSAAPSVPAAPSPPGSPSVPPGPVPVRAEVQASPPAAGPLVDTVRCDQGHLNPLTVSQCRVCGMPLKAQVPSRQPRPQLGILRMSTGDVIPLDRDVVFGRTPSAEAAGLPSDTRLVTLTDANQDTSRTHCAIHLDQWVALIADLNSTNGTTMSRPGRDPERLPANKPVVLEPGTTVTIAGEVSFRYEPVPGP